MKITSLNNIPHQAVSHNAAIQKKVMLHSQDVTNLIYFSQAEFPPGEKAAAHFHQDMCEVFFVELGSGIIYIDGKKYPLEKGVCVLVEIGEVHEIINNSSENLIITYFGLKVTL